MRESLIEKKCCEWAKSNEWLVYKFVSPNNRAVPDRIFIKRGEVVFVEFKALGKKPTKLQERIITRLRENGATVHVIDNLEDFINVMP